MTRVPLPDKAARTTALTDIARSYLVEAGAGSGKTSVMAGRVAVLLAQGVEPKNVAAITFTEFTASELRIRIDRFVNELSVGMIPQDLESAFPKKVTENQLKNLAHARNALDQLVCTTIHGFAQALIKPYPAEAKVDPGAEIIDPAEADLAFEEHYLAWLKTHLAGEHDEDIVAELVLADESKALALLSSTADFLRHNRDAIPAHYKWSSDACGDVIKTAKAFAKELGKFAFTEEKTQATCSAFIEIASVLESLSLTVKRPKSRALIEAACIPQDPASLDFHGPESP
jgi:ATP-dependent exoDNAse (exonuclease V) beta subunit